MDAFRNDMHGRLLRDEIPVYDYLIELAPFALVFMTTRELSYMGACEQIIIGTRCGICDLRIFRKGLGSATTKRTRPTYRIAPARSRLDRHKSRNNAAKGTNEPTLAT